MMFLVVDGQRQEESQQVLKVDVQLSECWS